MLLWPKHIVAFLILSLFRQSPKPGSALCTQPCFVAQALLCCAVEPGAVSGAGGLGRTALTVRATAAAVEPGAVHLFLLDGKGRWLG